MTANDILEALEYLQSHKMTDEQLDALHHKKSKESFSAALEYWRRQAEKHAPLREPSVEHGSRLLYVMKQHREGGGSFPQLIDQAWEKQA